MTKNMGTADRAVRFFVAIAIVALYSTDVISGTVAVILGIVAIAFLITSWAAWCPAYLPFGLSTCKNTDSTADS